MAKENRTISNEELLKHDNRKSCWIAVHGVVMDITPFLNEHPGGPDVVVAVSGRDCTQEFEDVGHTDSARRLGDKYIIGTLEGTEVLTELRLPTTKEVHDRHDRTNSGRSLGVFAAMTAVAAVAAAVYHAYFSHK